MKKIIVLLMFSSTTLILSQPNFNAFNAFKSMMNLQPLASSHLIEKGKPHNFYSHNKAFDNDKNTAWVEGIKGDGINEWITFGMKSEEGAPWYKDYLNNKKTLRLKLEIINGLAVNEVLFKANNRIKKAIIEIYEAAIRPAQGGIFIDSSVILNSTTEITLKDTIKIQKFNLSIRPKHPKKSGLFLLMGRLVIKEVYRGTKYRDTCISEIKLIQIGDPKPLFP